MKHPIVIGIAGGSGSGKSTYSHELAKRLGERRYNGFADAAQAATGVRPDNARVYLPAGYFAAGALGYGLNLIFIVIERRFIHWGGK